MDLYLIAFTRRKVIYIYIYIYIYVFFTLLKCRLVVIISCYFKYTATFLSRTERWTVVKYFYLCRI